MFRASLVVGLIGLGCAGAKSSAPGAAEAPSGVCARAVCRELVPGKPPRPYVFDDVISIYPGETFSFTGEVSGDRLVRLRYLADPQAPGPKVTLEFSTLPTGMMLKVTNGFDRMLKYQALMQQPDNEFFTATSSCPVHPGSRFMVETWPHPIAALLMLKVHFVPDSAAQRCD